MGDEGRPIRLGGAVPYGGEPDIADLLDPVALEQRLKDARARRAAALAGRRPVEPPPRPDFLAEAAASFLHPAVAVPVPAPRVEAFTPGTPADDRPAPVVVPEPVVAVGPADEAETPRPVDRLVRVPVWAIFATGLALGAAGVALIVLAPTGRPVAPAPAVVAVEPLAAAPSPSASDSVASPDAPSAAEATPPLPDPEALGAATAAVAPPAIDLPVPAAEPAPAPPDALEAAVAAAPFDTATAAAVAPGAETAPETAPEAAPMRELAPRPRAAPAPTVASGPVAPADGALPTRVTIHYPASGLAAAEDARAALAAAGVADVRLLPVRLDISRSNVRFYHAADGAAATTVAGLLSDGGEPPLARDFTDYRTPAAAGTLEVWLAGTSGTPSASAPAAPRVPDPAPDVVTATTLGPAPTTLPPPVAVAPAAPAPARPVNQAETVARIIVERAYERLMGAMPRD